MPNRLRVAIVAFSIFSATFASNALSPLYVIYEGKFGFSALSLTAIFGTYALAVLVALLCTGRLSDKVGQKPLLLAGSGLLMVSTLVFLTAPDTAALFIGRAVLGLATGTISTAGTRALVDLQRDNNTRTASLITTLAFLTGAGLGPLVFGLVAQYVAHPTVTPYLIELGLQGAGLVGLTTLAEPATHVLTRFEWRIERPSVPREIRRTFAVAAAVVTTGWMIGGLYGSLSGSMDRQLLHVRSHALAGVVLFVLACVGGGSQLLLRNISARTTMIYGVLTSALGALVLEVSLVEVSAPLFVVATVVVGIGNGLTFVGSLALINQVAPKAKHAAVISAYNVVAYLALSVPVIGVGLLANLVGLKSATTTFTAVVVVLSILTVVALRRSTLPAAVIHDGDDILASIAP
jgi:MFS family permease